MTSIKIVFGSDIRRFKIDPQLKNPFEYISKVILQTYGPDLEIRYEDDEGDLCLVTSEDEMKEALRLVSGSKPLKLKLQSKVSVLPIDDLDGLSDLKVSTELPPISSELPPVSSELPPVSSELPPVSSELPPVSSELPPVSSELPPVSSELPPVSSDLPPVSSDLPPVSSEIPAVSSEPPAVSATEQIAPEEVVSVPLEEQSFEKKGEPAVKEATEPLPEEKVEEPVAMEAWEPENETDVHLSVLCDACKVTPIVGVRYRCYVCKRVDLCSACEAQGIHAPDHPLIKIKVPVPSDFKFESRALGSIQSQCPPKAKFVREGNIPDGSSWKRGQKITKIWVLQNNGKSSWPRSRLVHVGGPLKPLADQPLIPLAAPGEVVSISLNFQLPDQPGRLTSFFRLVDEGTGERFGPRVWIDVIVTAESFLESVAGWLSGKAAPKPAPKPAEFQYDKELTVLKDMGFSDEARLKELLLKHNGHVQTVANVFIS